MSWKTVYPCALVLTVLGIGAVRAQERFPPMPRDADAGPGTAAAAGEAAPSANVTPSAGLSDYILYTKHGCCGPVGGDGPIRGEFYLRSGPSLPVEGVYFGHTLETGWDIDGGGRILFFNTEGNSDWSVNFGLSNIRNQGQHSDIKATLRGILVPNAAGTATRIPSIDVSVMNLNRTFTNFGFGKEWYLLGGGGCADGSCGPGGCAWIAGIDAGGRYGTARLELNELRHRSDVIGGVYVALHTDLEWQCGNCCRFLAGFRAEWDYTWMDILQRTDADLEDVNLLFTIGVQY